MITIINDKCSKEIETINKSEYQYVDNMKNLKGKCIFLKENDEVVGYCVYEEINKTNLLSIISEDYGEDLPSEVYDDIRGLEGDNFVFLHLFEIAKTKQNNGYGKKFLQLILKNHINFSIIIQSVSDSEIFWDKQGFDELLSYYKVFQLR